MATQPPKFVRWAVLIGIVIALNLFFVAARSIAFPEPQYNDYCPAASRPAPMDEKSCVAADGIWNSQPSLDVKMPAGYCDTTSKCQKPFEDATKQFRMTAFVIMVGLGVLSLIVGVLPIGSSIVSSGLSYGGVLALIIAAGQYWSDADSLVKLLISVVALGALIYIGIRRFRD